jgi:hypothetical protein
LTESPGWFEFNINEGADADVTTAGFDALQQTHFRDQLYQKPISRL